MKSNRERYRKSKQPSSSREYRGTSGLRSLGQGIERLERRELFAGDFDFATSFGTTATMFSSDVATDSSGNMYVAGHFEGTVDFDPGQGETFVRSATGGSRFIAKFNENGTFSWVRRVPIGGTPSVSGFSALDVSSNGDVYLAGEFSGAQDFDPGVGVSVLNSVGGTNTFVMKLSTTGNFVWAKQLGGSLIEVTDLVLGPMNDIHVVGQFHGTVDFDPGSAVRNMTASAGYDGYIAKLTSSGNYVWARRIGGTFGSDGVQNVAVDESGSVISTGYFAGSVDFDPSVFGTNFQTSVGVSDTFVLKLNQSGNFVWARQFDTQSETDLYVSVDVGVDAVGNVVLSGLFQGTRDFDPLGGVRNLTSVNNGTDRFFVKLSGTGRYLWANTISEGSSARIHVESTGEIYVAGGFAGTEDFDPSDGVIDLWAVSSPLPDIFVLKLEPTGAHAWVKRIGGGGIDVAAAVTVDEDDRILTTGVFARAVDFDPGDGVFYLEAILGTDVFISRLSSDAGNSGNSTLLGQARYNEQLGGYGIDMLLGRGDDELDNGLTGGTGISPLIIQRGTNQADWLKQASTSNIAGRFLHRARGSALTKAVDSFFLDENDHFSHVALDGDDLIQGIQTTYPGRAFGGR